MMAMKRALSLFGPGSLRTHDALGQDRAQFIEHALDQCADEGGRARKVVIDGGDRQIGPARDLPHLEAVGADLAQDLLGRVEQRALARPAALLLGVASARCPILRRDRQL